MCQKAFGGYFGALVVVDRIDWTRGAPAYFASSNLVRRGFCAACGTPLTYEPEGGKVDVAIAAFDDPSAIAPEIQYAEDVRIASFDGLAALPAQTPEERARHAAFYAAIVSNQHPDHDTAAWPPPGRAP